MLILADGSEKDVSNMSVHEARLQAAALAPLADNSIRREAQGRIAELHRHLNSFANISRLPEELIIQILVFAVVVKRRAVRKPEVNVRRVVELTKVCTRWCEIIRASALFWTCISNQQPAHMVALSRSQQALLDVRFVGHAGAENFFQHLDPHRQRWRSIVLDFSHYIDADADSDSDSNVDVFDDLWGPNLRTLHATYSSGLSTSISTPLPLSDSLQLTELVTENISFGHEYQPGGLLPKLTVLCATGFEETPDQWTLILDLIATSQRLQELVVAPRVGDPSFSRLHLAEVDKQDIAPLELPELRRLDVAQMPPKTFALFFRRMQLDHTTLKIVDLQIADPLGETLEDISNPAACSASFIIHSISRSQLKATVTATIGHQRNTFHYDAYTDSDNDSGVQITLDAPDVLPSVVQHMSPLFNHDQSPRLHVQLCGEDFDILDQEFMASFIEATPSTVTFRVGYGLPSTHVFELLKTLIDAPWTGPTWWWPQLKVIRVADLEDMDLVEDFRENLMAVMRNRSSGFDAGHCLEKVTIKDNYGRTMRMNGRIAYRTL